MQDASRPFRLSHLRSRTLGAEAQQKPEWFIAKKVLPVRTRKYVDFARALRDPSLMNLERLNLVLRSLTKRRWSLAIALVAALWQRGMESAPSRDSTVAFPGSNLVRALRLGMQWELAMAQSACNDPQSRRMIAGNCGLARQWHQALAGLYSLRSAGIELTNDAIRGTFTAPDDAWQGSLKFLRMLRRTALVPSSVEFSKVLSFSAPASWSYTLYFLSLARMEAVEITDRTSSASFSAFCQRFRPWKYACSLLRDFKQWAVVLQRSSFNSALGVFAQRPSLWKQVLGFALCIDVDSLDSGHRRTLPGIALRCGCTWVTGIWSCSLVLPVLLWVALFTPR